MFCIVIINTLFTWSSFAAGLANIHNGGGKYLPQFILFMLVSGIAAILPPVVAYLVGQRGGSTDSPYEHRYNGVLFAMLAGWLSLTFGFLPFTLDSMAVVPLVSGALSLLIALIVAFFYGRSRRPVSLEAFTPYRVMLVGALIAIIIQGLVSMLGSMGISQDPSAIAISIATIGIFVLIIWFGYRASLEASRWSRVIDSIIAFSIGMWTINLVSLLLMNLRVTTLVGITPTLVGLVAWGVYLYLIHLRFPAAKLQKARKRR